MIELKYFFNFFVLGALLSCFNTRYTAAIPQLGLSQNEFAARLYISPRALQNWEQGRRYPTGSAATLIRILDAHPSLI